MGIGGLAGGFGAAMGWGVIAEGCTFNMTLGSGIGEAVQTGAQFLVSNSGVVFEGLGYATAAGGGGFLTYEAIKGINNYEMDYGKSNEIGPYISSTENPSILFDVHNTGASMQIAYTYSGGKYNWFQTVSSNQPFGANSLSDYFIIDNGGSLSSPWYPPEYRHQGSNSQIILYDTPNRSSLLSGMYWEAESSLFNY